MQFEVSTSHGSSTQGLTLHFEGARFECDSEGDLYIFMNAAEKARFIRVIDEEQAADSGDMVRYDEEAPSDRMAAIWGATPRAARSMEEIWEGVL